MFQNLFVNLPIADTYRVLVGLYFYFFIVVISVNIIVYVYKQILKFQISRLENGKKE